MDMHTDTTAHLVAEGADIPARAGKSLAEALNVQQVRAGWSRSGLLYDRKKAAYCALETLVKASNDARTPEIAAALSASAQADGEHKFEGLLPVLALTEPYRTLRQAVMDTWAWFEAATIFSDLHGRLGGEEIYDAAHEAADAAVKALLAYSPTSLFEITDKMALFERIDHIDDHEDYASILRDLQRLSRPSAPTDPIEPSPSPIGPGHAVSNPAPDPTSPLGRAISAREALRAERQAWEDERGDNAPENMEKRVSAANLAVYSTPAVSVGEIRWKLLENVMEAEGLWSHDEAERYLSNEGGLDGASQRGILFDLDALAEVRMPAFAPDREFLETTLDALEHDGNFDQLMTQRPMTIAGLLARAAQVEDHFPAEFLPSFSDYDRMLVRALIGDIKALYAAQPSVSYSGADEMSARWIAAKLANRLVGDSKTSTGFQAGAPELPAAE